MLASRQSLNHVQHLTIGEEHAGQRIDNFLVRLLKGVPKSHLYRIIRKGEVRVNKGRVRADRRLVSGDSIRVPPVRCAKNESSNQHPSKKLSTILADSVLYEDSKLLIINKPPGLAVHGGSGVSLGLIEAIRAMRPNARFLELVHRLDKETSGCIMIAKERALLLYLHDALREGDIVKRYLAVVSGQWAGGKVVSVPLQKTLSKSGERRVRVTQEGKSAQSRVKVLALQEGTSLLEVSPITGRTHQIRVHCAYMGHPILGDSKYGEQKTLSQGAQPSRLFLHAHELTLKLPYTPFSLTVRAEIPDEFTKFQRLTINQRG